MAVTMNVSLSESLKEFVDTQVKRGGYSGTSDYVRDLIRDHQKQVAAAQLRDLIAEGLASGPTKVADAKYWAAKRRKLAG